MTADEKFLSRWSRLKKLEKEAQQTEAKPPQPESDVRPAPAAAPPVPAKESPAAPAELPPIESLKGLASDYTEFLKPGVDEGLKREALKKLFRDPYFETFEKFEAYCEDYTQGEPIPPAMLRNLEHAKGLLFDEKEEDKKKEEQRDEVATAKPQLDEAPAQVETKTETAHPEPQDKT